MPTEPTAALTRDDIARAFWLGQFGDFLTLEDGATPRTVEAYERDVTRFADYSLSKGARAPEQVGSNTLRSYIYHLKDLGLAPSSIRRNISALRTYYKFLLNEGHVVRDPSERLESPRRGRELPDVLTADEVVKLIEMPSLDEPLAFRDRAMLELAYGAGLRVGEWITLSVRDLMLDESLVRVFGKGSKERLVPIGRKAVGAGAIYLRELRPRLEKGSGEGVLFLNARGEPMTRRVACNIIKK
jgi:integrase/recombinase XerD